MRKLTYILLVLFTGNATYAQVTGPTTDKTDTHGQTVSTAARATASGEVSADATGKGEYVREMARSKKAEASQAANAFTKETQEAAAARFQELSETQASLGVNTQVVSPEEGALTSETALTGSLLAQGKGQGKSQDKAKAEKKEVSKEKASDKTQKEQDNHGKKVKATAQQAKEDSKEKGQDVKEVASAKRQEKPEKVEAGAKAEVEVKAPRSAARPGRGAARAVQGSAAGATKAVGNAAKAAKPVKVGGKVGVGSVIKVGKN
ncbi:hypothetical protein GU926_06615 [Nibribacter ruber]|uniref:Uncharacterized protein n=1 Tax=Nibribacter ruber TaxID=2698458 RepID=A0A6P1NYR7_9BACT|nr:hypothetical protein [Nibribacter ruber]QHL87118.1 hypothetical protein GU926_06615 [Nibribacter ruber]